MGVRGFLSYIRRNDHLIPSDLSQYKTVVIDGSNICHFLYNNKANSHFPGSDYSSYARRCRHYFQALLRCGVKPYVVFDGGNNTNFRHFNTSLRRKQKIIDEIQNEDYGQLPLFARITFCQVLTELGVDYVSTTFEADKDIAVLAHKWNCAIMSGDSDFYIYLLEQGCIQYPFLHSDQLENNTIPIKLYQYRSFVNTMNIPANILPLFAIVMGNDYVDRAILLRLFIEKHWFENDKRADEILTWLNTFRGSIDDVTANVIKAVLKGDDATRQNEEAFNAAIADYRLDKYSSFDLGMYFRAQNINGFILNDYYGKELPVWFTEGIVTGKISSSIQDVFVLHRVVFTCQGENVELPSSFVCSRSIRQCIYGVAVAKAGQGNLDIFIVEHDRRGKKCFPNVTKPIRQLCGSKILPDLHTISNMKDKERQQLFLSCFNVEAKHLDGTGIEMDDVVVPLMVSLSFWFKHAQPSISEKHIDAVLICAIYLHMKSFVFHEKCHYSSTAIIKACEEIRHENIHIIEKELYSRYEQEPSDGWDKNTLHAFAQFFACFRDTDWLNQVLKEPFRIASPIVTFNSRFAYNFYTDLVKRPNSKVEELCGLKQRPVYSRLLCLFTTMRKKVLNLSQIVQIV